MKIRFLEIAQSELDNAINYYNSERPGLGQSFLDEILKALDRVGNFPTAWQPCSKRTRRCQIHPFPYGIIYQILRDEIMIVAVAHLHHRPEYWKNRI